LVCKTLVGVGSNWGSMSNSMVCNSDWGSMSNSMVCDSDWGSSISLVCNSNWGSMSNGVLDSNWVSDGVGLLLNDWGLNNMLDLVDWVGLWDSVWGWDLNLVWLSNVLVDNDLPLNWGWHSNWDLNLVLVDLQLRLNPGHLWGDHSVGPGGSQDLLLGDSVSRGWSQVDWCWWNSSIWCRGNWSSWDRQLLGDNLVGGWGMDKAVSSWLVDRLTGLDVLMSDLDSPGASLDSAVSDNSVLYMGLSNGWASMDSLLDVGGSGTVGYVSWSMSQSNWVAMGVSGGGAADSSKKRQNQKSSHDACCYCYCSE